MEELKRKIEERLNEWKDFSFIGEVISVNETENSCNVERSEGVIYYNVRLNSIINEDEKGIVFVPKKGSKVLVERLGGSNELYVSLYSSLTKIKSNIGEFSLSITEDGIDLESKKITINGGDNGGLIKIEELTDKINALVDKFNNHTHMLSIGSVNVTGSPSAQTNPAPISVPAIMSKATKLSKSDYENKDIKH